MTQRSVAQAAGVTRGFYGAVETGRKNISIDRVFAIADVLGIDAGVLFTDLLDPPEGR